MFSGRKDLMNRVRDVTRPPLIIAEAADAHYGDLERAKLMALKAKTAGAEVIKFQHHLPQEEMLREIPRSSNMREPLWDFLEKNALKLPQHVELSQYCDQIGITYVCTPFSLVAARELEASVKPLFFKIGSGEMLDFPSLLEIAKFGRPMFLSTGMSTIEEIDELYAFINPLVDEFVLMNCTSAYPTPPEEMHLSFISEMITRYPDAIIGHSEHSRENLYSLAAVALGSRVIERHVTIDEALSGPDAEVSMNFEQLKEFVAQVHDLSIALNVSKKIQPSEWEIRQWAHRSLVYLEDLEAGHTINGPEVWAKRPGTGIPARYRDRYIGRTLRRGVEADTLLSPDDFAD